MSEGKESPKAPIAPIAQAPAKLDAKKQIEQAFAKADGKGVKVIATARGIYPNCWRRKAGDEFKVSKLQHFSSKWMKLAE